MASEIAHQSLGESPGNKFVGWAVAGACILALFGAGQFKSLALSCVTESQAKVIASELAASLQSTASAGKLTPEELAKGVRAINEAASDYQASGKAAAYCSRLRDLRASYGKPQN